MVSVPYIWSQNCRSSISVACQIVSALRGTLYFPRNCDCGEGYHGGDCQCASLSDHGEQSLRRLFQWTEGTSKNRSFLKLIFGEILLPQDYLSYSDVIQNLEVKSRVCFNSKIYPKICGIGLTAGQRGSRKLLLKTGRMEILVFQWWNIWWKCYLSQIGR